MASMAKTDEQTPVTSDQKAKIVLYWLEESRSQRILWLLEEVKAEYELKTYKRENMLAPAEFKEIHPLGKAPIITIETEGMSKPLALAESGLMVEYLVDHFGPWLAPKRYKEGKEGQIGGETEEWMRYKYFLHYAEGSLMTPLIVAVLVGAIKSGSPFFLKPIINIICGQLETRFLSPTFKTHLEFLESQISTSPGGGEYLCGKELTGADILMSFPLTACKGRPGLTKEKYPKLWAYVDKIEAREAHKRAVEKIVEIEGVCKVFLV